MDQVYNKTQDLSTQNTRAAAYYAIIPAEVRYNQQLSPNAKLLYGEISALATREGYCFASNQYFADLYQVAPRSIIRMIKQLESYGFIRAMEERDKVTGQTKGRRIYLAVSAAEEHQGDKIVTPIGQNCQGEGDKNVTPLLIINNNKYINSAESKKKSKPISAHAQFAAWVQERSVGWEARDTARVLEAFEGFAGERAKNKNPIGAGRAITLLCNRLADYSGGDPAVMAEMLDDATLKGWKSVYPPDGKKRGAPAKKQEADDEWL